VPLLLAAVDEVVRGEAELAVGEQHRQLAGAGRQLAVEPDQPAALVGLDRPAPGGAGLPPDAALVEGVALAEQEPGADQKVLVRGDGRGVKIGPAVERAENLRQPVGRVLDLLPDFIRRVVAGRQAQPGLVPRVQGLGNLVGAVRQRLLPGGVEDVVGDGPGAGGAAVAAHHADVLVR
jgi:hypothetical protein